MYFLNNKHEILFQAKNYIPNLISKEFLSKSDLEKLKKIMSPNPEEPFVKIIFSEEGDNNLLENRESIHVEKEKNIQKQISHNSEDQVVEMIDLSNVKEESQIPIFEKPTNNSEMPNIAQPFIQNINNEKYIKDLLMQQLNRYSLRLKQFYAEVFEAMEDAIEIDEDFPESDMPDFFCLSFETFQKTFCKNNIAEEKEVLRIALNVIFLEKFKKCPDYEHSNILNMSSTKDMNDLQDIDSKFIKNLIFHEKNSHSKEKHENESLIPRNEPKNCDSLQINSKITSKWEKPETRTMAVLSPSNIDSIKNEILNESANEMSANSTQVFNEEGVKIENVILLGNPENTESSEDILEDDSLLSLDPFNQDISKIAAQNNAIKNQFEWVKCNICFETVDKIHIKSHLKIHGHNNDQVEWVKCNICFENVDKTYIKSHLKIHEQFSAHFSTALYKNEENSELNTSNDITASASTTAESQLYCIELPKNQSNSEDVTVEKIVINTSEIYVSEKNDNGKMCQFCGKSFKKKHNLLVHMRIHNELRPFVCRYCTQTFRQKAHLQRHESTHTGYVIKRQKRKKN